MPRLWWNPKYTSKSKTFFLTNIRYNSISWSYNQPSVYFFHPSNLLDSICMELTSSPMFICGFFPVTPTSCDRTKIMTCPVCLCYPEDYDLSKVHSRKVTSRPKDNWRQVSSSCKGYQEETGDEGSEKLHNKKRNPPQKYSDMSFSCCFVNK